jgi:hypothetical protein
MSIKPNTVANITNILSALTVITFLVKKLLESDFPGARGPGFTPDSWLRHRNFKNIFQAKPNDSDLAQRARVSGTH